MVRGPSPRLPISCRQPQDGLAGRRLATGVLVRVHDEVSGTHSERPVPGSWTSLCGLEPSTGRPCTIAKGAETCEFAFYRRGTAPEIELIDGVPMRWEERLNR